jgi:hypothetical protein
MLYRARSAKFAPPSVPRPRRGSQLRSIPVVIAGLSSLPEAGRARIALLLHSHHAHNGQARRGARGGPARRPAPAAPAAALWTPCGLADPCHRPR